MPTIFLAGAISSLLHEYEVLDKVVSVPAQGRRTVAVEKLCAVTFYALTKELDPFGMDDLTEQVTGASLKWSLFVTDLMVTAMLDFHEQAKAHGYRSEIYRDPLQQTLTDIWSMALGELLGSADDDAAASPL